MCRIVLDASAIADFVASAKLTGDVPTSSTSLYIPAIRSSSAVLSQIHIKREFRASSNQILGNQPTENLRALLVQVCAIRSVQFVLRFRIRMCRRVKLVGLL